MITLITLYIPQVAAMSTRATDLLIATPGRLVDMCKHGKVSLAYVRFVAMDEADKMLGR